MKSLEEFEFHQRGSTFQSLETMENLVSKIRFNLGTIANLKDDGYETGFDPEPFIEQLKQIDDMTTSFTEELKEAWGIDFL